MKRFINRIKVCLGILAITAFVVAPAGAQVNERGNKNFTGLVNLNHWSIDGAEVTATAANLNSGVASSTATLVSNATLKVYASNVVVTTSITLPAASVASASIAAGNLANIMVLSNANSQVYASNITATTTITVPAGSLATASLAGNKYTGIMTNGVGSAYTSRTFIANGVITNVAYAPSL